MTLTSLSQLDWNLVPTLASLLRERSVSRTARMLGLSQSTVSGSLGRLRRHFGDPLLVRSGNGLELTPLGHQLLPMAERAEDTVRVLVRPQGFDAAAETGEVTIALSDYGQHTLGQRILARASAEAPNLGFRFTRIHPGSSMALQDALATCDAVVLPRGILEEEPRCELFTDRWVGVVDKGHPEVGACLTPAQTASLGWVAVAWSVAGPQPGIFESRSSGPTPRLELATDSYTAVPFLVAGSTRVGLLQSRLAQQLAQVAGVRQVPCPWPAPALRLSLYINPARRHEPRLQWLVGICAAAGADLGPTAPDLVGPAAPLAGPGTLLDHEETTVRSPAGHRP